MWRVWKRPRLLATMVLVAAIAAAALWPESIEVDVVRVARGALQVTLDEEGETRVRERYVISAPVAGRLQRIELEPGDAVRRGRTIVVRLTPADPALLDPRTRAELAAAVEGMQAAVGQARAERARAAAALDRARASLGRQQQLAEAALVSRDDLEATDTASRAAEEALRAADFAVRRTEYELQLARARLQRPGRGTGGTIDIASPVDGVVLKRHRESESVVASGEPLLEVGDPAEIEVVSDLLSADAVRVRPGVPVRLEQWGGGPPIMGRVRRVEPSGFMKVSALGVEEQRVNVIIDFADAAAVRALGDGYRVEVRIITWQEPDVLKVPIGTLFRQGDAWAVFVVDNGRARTQVVDIGQRNGTEAQVVKGLQAGDAIVLHAPDTLRDGLRITQRRQ